LRRYAPPTLPRPFDALLFDFDYTLGDSSPGVAQCMRYAFESLGKPVPDDDAIRRQIGLPLAGTVERLSGDPDPESDAAFVRLFVERADQVMLDSTTLFPGVPDMLRALGKDGLRLGVVSTKFGYRLDAILRRADLRDVFELIVGGDDVAEPKPHPAGLQRALELLALPTERVLYVGDSLVDAQAAQRTPMMFAAVLSGTTVERAFDAYPCRAVLPSVRALPALISSPAA